MKTHTNRIKEIFNKEEGYEVIMIIILIIFFLFLIYIIYDNLRITIRKDEIKIGKTEENIRILHLSDFHNRKFGKDNNYLINRIKEVNPDLILISGDLIDHRSPKSVIVESLLERLNKILENTEENPKIFYVYGNHEQNQDEEYLIEYEEMLRNKNIKLLKNEINQLDFNGKKINIIGLDDTRNELVDILINDFHAKNISVLDFIIKENDSAKANLKIIKTRLDKIFKENTDILKDGYNILLTHRPEGFEIYKDYDIDLVLSGHAHGGQARIPFTNISVIAPNQGIFPKYTKGPYESNGTKMHVSAGIGNSLIPIRIFNPSELIQIDIKL